MKPFKNCATTSQTDRLYSLTGKDWAVFTCKTSKNRLTKEKASFIIDRIIRHFKYGLDKSRALVRIREFYPDYDWAEISTNYDEEAVRYSELRKERKKRIKEQKKRARALARGIPTMRLFLVTLQHTLNSRKGELSYIYFFQEVELGKENPFVKIGRTAVIGADPLLDIEARRSSVNCGNWRELKLLFFLKGSSKAEKLIHKQFDKQRIYREDGNKTEWFHIEGELKDFIEVYT